MPLCSPLTGADELKSTKLWLQQSDPNVQTTKLRPRLTFSVSEEISVDDFILDLLLDQLLEHEHLRLLRLRRHEVPHLQQLLLLRPDLENDLTCLV